MYDFDMMESMYEDFDDDFYEACENCDFDDLFTEDENGDCEYIGDIYTEAFGKKKKKGGFSLGGGKKKKRKGKSGKKSLPKAAKVTAAVAAALAVGAGVITVIKMIMRKAMNVTKGTDFTATIEKIKNDMKDLKKEHKEYCTGKRKLDDSEKKEEKKLYRGIRREYRKDLTIARLHQFCANKLTVINALISQIKKVGNKIASFAEQHNIPVPFKKKLNDASPVKASSDDAVPTAESAFIESVVNTFLNEAAEYMNDDMDDLYDDVYESVFSDYDDDEYDYDDLF